MALIIKYLVVLSSDEYDSSRRLSDRINDVTRWRENPKACAQQVDAEMDALTLVINVSIKDTFTLIKIKK